jgi:hypothetical protein
LFLLLDDAVKHLGDLVPNIPPDACKLEDLLKDAINDLCFGQLAVKHEFLKEGILLIHMR